MQSHSSALTPAAEDHLKAIWKADEWDGTPMTTGALARALGTTPASVSDMIRRLAERGLVDHEPYRPVGLTAAGRAAAERVVRRHRIVETFLVAELGYGWDEVHDEAEALEHHMSDRLVDALDARLGFPAADPHGDPIPRDGTVPGRPRGQRALGEAAPGRYRVVRLSDDVPERLAYFAERGIVPGAELEVTGRDDVSATVTVRVTATPGEYDTENDPATGPGPATAPECVVGAAVAGVVLCAPLR